MSKFARYASVSCPEHEDLALSLAEALGRDPERIRSARLQLGELAALLPRAGSPEQQIAALDQLSDARLAPRLGVHDDRTPLLLTDVLDARGGHPVGVAITLAAVARRAGYDTGVIGNGNRLYLAHTSSYTIWSPSNGGGLIDATWLGVDLEWRCAHETAFVMLRTYADRAQGRGDLARMLAASALIGTLPVSHMHASGARDGAS